MRSLIVILIISVAAGLQAQQSFLFQPTGANFYVYNQGGRQFVINQSKMTAAGLGKVMEKLSSGKRINRAGDDPAGLAVSEKIDAIMRGIKQESMNMQDFRNYLRYVDAMAGQDTRLLQRIRELIVRSAGGILTKDDREIIQTEIDQYLRQINMNARFSKFNTKIVIPELTVKGLNLDGVDVVRDPYRSIKLVDDALKKVVRRRILAGVKSNVLTYRIQGAEMYYVNMASSLSRVLDQNMAEGISSLSQKSVLLKTQYGIMMLGK